MDTKTRDEQVNLVIMGERKSGTSIAVATLCAFVNASCNGPHGQWKHTWAMPLQREGRPAVARCLVVVVRNPYSWAASMGEQPFSGQAGLTHLPLDSMISRPWNATEDCSSFTQQLIEHQCLPAREQGGPVFSSLAAFRTAKMLVYLDALSQHYSAGTHLLRYEDLLLQPQETLEQVAASCSTHTIDSSRSVDEALAASAWHGSRPQTALFGLLSVPFDLDGARRALLQSPRELLGATAYKALDSRLDWGVEAFLGYSPGTLLPSVQAQSIPWSVRQQRAAERADAAVR